MNSTIKILFLLGILAVILLGINKFVSHEIKFLTPKNTVPQIVINGKTILVEMADTPEKIVQGLSGREKLPENTGMLFVFKKADEYTFWMKDMKFNLDFVFIRGQKVVNLAENIPFPGPGQEPQTVVVAEPFDQVLEITAGQIKKLNLKIDDTIQLQ